jgi:predicted TIM-barrel fold metal-dependent hydrolase
VAHADLTLGDAVEEVLQAHEAAGRGLFRGIRHALARAEDPEALMIPGRAPKGLYRDSGFREGLRALGRLGLTYDTWHYHYQNRELAELARAVPDTAIILDHFGTPLGVGPYANRREEIFEDWKQGISEVASCPNVVAKLGGMAMPDNGFGWNTRATPPRSDEFVEAQRRYYLHTIECFGPDRCMLESNFPVDKLSISYPVLYNGLKKIVSGFSEAEKDAMFSGTARRVYRL